MNEDVVRRLLNHGLPDEDLDAAQRMESVLRRCREQVHGRDTITLLFARLWVALATLLTRLLYLPQGRPNGRIGAYFAASPPG